MIVKVLVKSFNFLANLLIYRNLLHFYLNAIYCFRGSSRGGPGGRVGGFVDRGGRGMGGGRGGPTKRGVPPSGSGPSKRPRFDQSSSQPSNGYATQPPK